MAPAFVTGAALPRSGLAFDVAAVTCAPARTPPAAGRRAQVVSMSKNAQLKAAKKAHRRRPKKHRPSDITRAPPSFDPNPLAAEGLPAVMTIVPEADFTGEVLVSAEDVDKYNAAVAEAEEAERSEADKKRAAAAAQRKADRAEAVKVKMAAHAAHKEAREAAIRAFGDKADAEDAAESSGDGDAGEEAADEEPPAADAPKAAV